MKNIKNIIRLGVAAGTVMVVVSTVVMINGCKVPESIANKSGMQLWSENCNRCHNAPDPKTYNNDQWDAAMEHMRQKAILTNDEVNKIRTFLTSN